MLIDGAVASNRPGGRGLGLPGSRMIVASGRLRVGQLTVHLSSALLLRELTFQLDDALLGIVLIHQQIVSRPLRSLFAGHFGGDLRSNIDGGRVIGGRAVSEDVDDDVVADGHHPLSGRAAAVWVEGWSYVSTFIRALVLKTPLVPEMGPTSDTSRPPDMMWAKLPLGL
jgi:hypothetical protein